MLPIHPAKTNSGFVSREVRSFKPPTIFGFASADFILHRIDAKQETAPTPPILSTPRRPTGSGPGGGVLIPDSGLPELGLLVIRANLKEFRNRDQQAQWYASDFESEGVDPTRRLAPHPWLKMKLARTSESLFA